MTAGALRSPPFQFTKRRNSRKLVQYPEVNTLVVYPPCLQNVLESFPSASRDASRLTKTLFNARLKFCKLNEPTEMTSDRYELK